MEPDGPGSLASQATKDQALQISAGRTGQAPQRRFGGRAQITPLCAQSIAGDDLRRSAQKQLGGYFSTGHELASGTLGPYACWSVIFRDRAGVCWRVHPNERPRIVGEKWFPGTSTPAAAGGGGSRRV